MSEFSKSPQRVCIICVKYKHGAKAMGRGMWIPVDFYRESQTKSTAPAQGRVMAWGAGWELEGRHSDCPSPAQELSPPHSPEGQTQLHPAVGTQCHLSGVVHPRPTPPTQLPGLDSL